jgi:hypothetical protein
MAFRLWLRGLLAAFVGAAATALSAWVIDPQDFNLETGLIRLGKIALVSGLMGAVLYLKKHPDPFKEPVE